MNRKAVIFDIHNPMNKGNFLSAKIYADVNKKNLCQCGGKFDLYVSYEDSGFDIPVCNSCNAYPTKFRIHARIEDDDGNKKTVCIRRNKRGKRLDKSARVIDALDSIIEDLHDGEFDYRDYDKKEVRENRQLETFINKIFLPQTLTRWKNKEVSKSTYNNYKKDSKHLINFFRNIEMDKINNSRLRSFMRSYDASTETKNRASNILRTILNEAYKQKFKKTPPNLDKMKATKKRLEVMDYKTARKIWGNVQNQKYKDIIEILLTYPIRPSEAYVLETSDFDLINKTITFDQHLSDGELTDGRKSQKIDSRYGKLTLPLTDRIINLYERNKSESNFLFKGHVGDHVSPNVVRRAWNDAREKAGIIPTENCKFQLYEIKHALVSHLDAQGVNISTIEKMSGVRAKTLMERYLYSTDELVGNAMNILSFKELA